MKTIEVTYIANESPIECYVDNNETWRYDSMYIHDLNKFVGKFKPLVNDEKDEDTYLDNDWY